VNYPKHNPGSANAASTIPNSTAPDSRYQSGFGNHFETEALPGALPQGKNSPQKIRIRVPGAIESVPRSNTRAGLKKSMSPTGNLRPTSIRMSSALGSTDGIRLLIQKKI